MKNTPAHDLPILRVDMVGHRDYSIVDTHNHDYIANNIEDPEMAHVIGACTDMLIALENLENDDLHQMPRTVWALVQYAIGKARGRHA